MLVATREDPRFRSIHIRPPAETTVSDSGTPKQVLTLHQYPPAAVQPSLVVQRVTSLMSQLGGGDYLITIFSTMTVPALIVSELIDADEGLSE